MRKLVASSVLASLGVLVAARAEAHFKLNAIQVSPSDIKMPVSWMSQDSTGGPQKTAPCGNEAGGTPTSVVTNVQAGQKVSLSVVATVAHTGWYRVALIEGASSSQTTTTLPDPANQTACKAAIISNPVWSTTQPVIADGLPPGSMGATELLDVTIPSNANCTAAKPCTLQVIMVMTQDHQPPNCYYHHCADITIGGGASSGSGGTGSGSGGAGGARATGGRSGTNGSGGTSGSGGISASGGANGSGGSSASGGADGTGGSTASGGEPGSGGSSASGGANSSGGTLASGGATSSGGKNSSGGTPGSGGSNTSSGSGGTTNPGADNSSSGCAVATHGETVFASLVALLLVALARRRRAG